MKITREQLKEIIREELLSEKTFKTRNGIKFKIDLIGYRLSIYGRKNNKLELKGHKDVGAFVKILSKNMRIS